MKERKTSPLGIQKTEIEGRMGHEIALEGLRDELFGFFLQDDLLPSMSAKG
jgi:hypothetical protein